MTGDGIGHEIVPATIRVVDAALAAVHGPVVDWQHLPLGLGALDEHGTPMPEHTLSRLRRAFRAWILGPHDSASYPKPFRSQLTPGGRIHKHFDLFANIRPAKALPWSARDVAADGPGGGAGEHRGLLRRPPA